MLLSGRIICFPWEIKDIQGVNNSIFKTDIAKDNMKLQ